MIDAATQMGILNKDREKIDYQAGRAALEGSEEIDLPTAEAIRAVASTFMIEDMWKIVYPERENFSPDIKANDQDSLSTIIENLNFFLLYRCIVTKMAMCDDPKRIRHYYNYLALTQSSSQFQENAAIISLNKNIQDGVNTTFSLIEVALKLKMKYLLTNNEAVEKWQGELEKTLSSKHFLRIILAIAFGSSEAENVFLNKILEDYGPNIKTGKSRKVLSPAAFFLDLSRKDGEAFIIEPATWERIKSDYDAQRLNAEALFQKLETLLCGIYNPHLMRRCPAAFAPGMEKNSTVLLEFSKWLIQIAVKHYIPWVIAQHTPSNNPK